MPLPSATPAPCFEQVSDRSLESQVLAEVLMATIEEPFYNSLRTKQQLGYMVFSGVSCVEGVR